MHPIPATTPTFILVSVLVYLADAIRSPRLLAPGTSCVPYGPLVPRPTNLRNAKIVQDATASLSQNLDDALSGKIKAGFDVDQSSFSIGLISSQKRSASLTDGGHVWSYHHLGKNNVNGTKIADENSQYLIGSISMLFTDVLLLKSNIDLNSPITKYLPTLQGSQSLIQWDNITLSALSNHLSGIPSNLPSSFDSYSLHSMYERLGFPVFTNASYPECGVTGLNRGCNQTQIIEMMSSALPVEPPYSQPIYSSVAYTLLGMALEAETGKTYRQLLHDLIVGPFGLTNTGISPGVYNRAVIPPLPIAEQRWGADYGANNPGAGLYSSLRDLSVFTTRILNYSIFDNPDQVRQWLKPHSMTSSVSDLVGQSWEVHRVENLVPENPHTVDIFAKSGGAQGYASHFSVVDQYGIGFVILTAGPRKAYTASILNDAVISALIPAVDSEARRQAEKYTGTFTPMFSISTETADPDFSPKLVLSMDNGTGIKIESLTRSGSDILNSIQMIWASAFPQFGILNPDMRIYPTEIERPVENQDSVIYQDWRISFDIIPSDNAAISDLPGQGTLLNVCSSWKTVDWLYYGGKALDRIVFKVNQTDGTVIGVDIPFLRSGLLGKT
ncbi:uncharacterized protein N7511_008303 [Penicillium nucicola]|uniref:uncharacterized protein n=1 Tax=Penicillium nucicola TaxID=1850975 RepID=UPI0025451291|nr:uncharacterized protein N7511_008303 [Penicillium nucicola]KAJ5754150.1 hypothetical protein N7511_008303 [Penicillium nucicola]